MRFEGAAPPCDVVDDGHVPHWTMDVRVMVMATLEQTCLRLNRNTYSLVNKARWKCESNLRQTATHSPSRDIPTRPALCYAPDTVLAYTETLCLQPQCYLPIDKGTNTLLCPLILTHPGQMRRRVGSLSHC